MKTMKKLMTILLLVLMIVSSVIGCSFNEDPLLDRLDDIKDRIAALQSRIDEANRQIEVLGLLTSGNVITSIEKNSDGSYSLTYLDNDNEEKTAVIAAREQLINVPVVGVRKDANGLYYWTVTAAGETKDITVGGESVPAAGKAPVISVDGQGYWTVNGERILDSEGNPIEAADGSASIIKNVVKDADGNLSVTLGNGTKITIPVHNSLNLSLSSLLNITIANPGQTLTISYDVTGGKAGEAIVAIAEAKDVNAAIDKKSQEISVSFGSDFTSGHLIVMATDLDRLTVLRPVFFTKAKETRLFIESADDLVAFAGKVNSQDGTENMDVYLEKDIDLSSIKEWIPIGNGTFSGTEVSGAAFKGTFHGQNHTVKGLNITVSSDAVKGYAGGLFGVLDGATVKDLTVGEGSSFTSSSALMASGGAVAGAVVNSTVDNCASYASFDISGGSNNVSQRFGGIAGSVYSDGEVAAQVTNCSNYGTFKSVNTTNTKNGGTAFSIGGVIGYAESASGALRVSVKSCDNYGTMNVQASRNAGVVATLNKNATLESCGNFADITNTDTKASNTRVAGIVSALSVQTSVINCVNKGDIIYAVAGNTTKGYAGGIAGQTNDNTCVIEGCENYGEVRSDIFNASDATKRFIASILANTNNKTITIKNNKVGGKVGPYSDESKVVTITAENFGSYIFFSPKTQPSVVSGNEFAGGIPAE